MLDQDGHLDWRCGATSARDRRATLESHTSTRGGIMFELVTIGLLVVGLAAGLSWQARRRDNRSRFGTGTGRGSRAQDRR